MQQEVPETILRGQMYYADLEPIIGSEQGGVRPVLILQNNVGNYHSPTIIIAPITTQVKKTWMPTHVGIPPCFDLPQESMVMLEQIRTLDRSRFREYVGFLPADVMGCIDGALRISVGLRDLAGQNPPTSPKAHGQRDDSSEMVLTLCPVCLRQFMCSPDHIVRRIDRAQEKETCMYCNVRGGYDYRIICRKKRLGDDAD
jgi:mRNA interferase MazF